MDGSSRGGRKALVLERGWKTNRLAWQLQRQAYRLALPRQEVWLTTRTVRVAGTQSASRLAAGGRP